MFRRPSGFLVTAVLIASTAGAAGLRAAEESTPEGSGTQAPPAGTGGHAKAIEEERPDQPPGKPAADDRFARTPGFRIRFGSYESIQVNVDAAGHNILGDAANEPSIAV